jgi:hypothetical protein
VSTFFASRDLDNAAVDHTGAMPAPEFVLPASTADEELTFESLREMLKAVDPTALLLEPRILRRVIRLDRRLKGLGFVVPHRKSYTIERERLLAFADADELGTPDIAELPRHVILLTVPTDDESLDLASGSQTLWHYWRMLFHARVHVELERRIHEHASWAEFARQRRQQIGDIEFAEIQAVLLKDEFLFPDPSDVETYIEFAAVYLELRYFAKSDLPIYFPSIRDWEQIDQIVSQDIYHGSLFESTRPPHLSAEPNERPVDITDLGVLPKPSGWARTWTGRLSQIRTHARRAAAMGNGVKAAIHQMRAAQQLSSTKQIDARRAAEQELRRVVQRLQPVLQLTNAEVDRWCAALHPLLAPAAQGFWSLEARLLYDLQKVCVEHERGVFKLDVIEWCRTLGRRPVRRPLPLLREVMITKHLRSAARRLATARLSPVARNNLAELLAVIVERIEHRSRDRIRPVILRALDNVGLVPRNLPENIARRNVVEELLDRIVEHGVVNLGNLRDALSKNDLKLPDLSGILELVRGDRLLRADRLLGNQLDGVYRPGAIYLRLAQRLSSLAFGTRAGRLATLYLGLPFGGAYLALEGLQHLAHWVMDRPTHGTPLYAVLGLGVWLALLIHRPGFRAWCIGQLRAAWHLFRQVVVEWPAGLLRSPFVQQILQSPAYAAARNYVVRPGVLGGLIWAVASRLSPQPLSLHFPTYSYLVSAIFLNSPIGRYADEWIGDVVMRAWHDLRMRVFAAAYQWIMDTFHRLLVALERVVYGVDEWLRFRAGDKRDVQAVKLVAGTCWFFMSYFVVFVFTLLVEPQINPIKHFPVVTVSHKLILPTGSAFVERLEPYIGSARAKTLVWSTIWLIPGVFGFLVWELKENWRLYAANRATQLGPVPLGHHGETMVRLLRPGFHSGTLPKLFAALRRAARKAHQNSDWKPVHKKQAIVHRAEESVRRFVERDFKGLLDLAQVFPVGGFSVDRIHVSTNRIEVALEPGGDPEQTTWLCWEEDKGRLTAIVRGTQWIQRMHVSQREMFVMALSGLFQRTGVQAVAGSIEAPLTPAITWDRWVSFWSGRSK